MRDGLTVTRRQIDANRWSPAGFARRYFTLYQSGILAYSFEPGQPIRDHIDLHHAAISSTPGRKDITLDSNTATFHIKCLSTDDFNQWMLAFRLVQVPSGRGRD